MLTHSPSASGPFAGKGSLTSRRIPPAPSRNVASARPVAPTARTVHPRQAALVGGRDSAQLRALARAVLEQTDDAAIEAPIVLDVAERFRGERIAGGEWRDSTRAINDDLLRDVCAEVGMLRMDEVGPDTTRSLLQLWGRTPIARRRVELLARLRRSAISHGESVGGDPLEGIKLPTLKRRERYLEIVEVTELGKALDADERNGLTTQAVARCIRGLLLTGVRLSEFARLRWSEVDLGGSVLRLRDSKVGARIVPIGADVVRWMSAMHRTSECVCPGRGDWKARPISTSGVRQGLARAADRAGIDGVMPHTLRHTWASTAYLSGVDLHTIQVVLGHSSPQQTATYLHVSVLRAIPETTRVTATLSAALSGGAA